MRTTLKYLALCLLLFQALLGLGQNKSSMAYRDNSQQSQLDSARYYAKNNQALAFQYIEALLETAFDKNDKKLELECYLLLGNINQEVQQYDLAITNYNKALQLATQIKDVQKQSEINGYMATSYEANNALDESAQYFEQSAKKAQNVNNAKAFKKSQRSLASVYQKQGADEKAIETLEEVREMDIADEEEEEQFKSNEQLIVAYSVSEPSRALELSEENEAIAIAANDTVAYLNTLKGKAEVYSNLGQPDEQLDVLQKSAEVRKTQKDDAGLSEDNFQISEVLVAQEKLDDAIAYLEKSIELSERSGKIETRKKALKSLSSVYDKAGNYNRALAIYKDYVKAAEESAKVREQKILENLDLMQSLNKRLQRIDMLENQQSLKDKTIALLEQERVVVEKSVKQQRLIIASLLLVLLILFITVYMVIRSSRQKRIANQLLALRSLRSQMNPHFIFNALNSVNSYISTNDERAANKYLSDFSKLMRAVMENSKYDFVSLASEIQILELYIKLEHHRFKDKFDYTFEVDESIDTENIQIPPMLIQPYIENAVWHGLRYREEKGYLKVQVSNGKHLSVLIEDNGIGRQKSVELKTKNQQENESTGLKNINNRLQIINQIHGTNLQVSIEDLDKQAKSGTQVTIELIQQ